MPEFDGAGDLWDVSGVGGGSESRSGGGVPEQPVRVHGTEAPDVFEKYTGLILAAGEAGRAKHEAMIFGDGAEIDAAGWASWDADGRVIGFEMDYANEWLLGFRLAMKHYPEQVSQRLDELFAMRAEWKAEAKRLDNLRADHDGTRVRSAAGR